MGLENLNLSVFKYPLGFIRIIQFVFLVIALSAANSWHAELTFQCIDAENKTVTHTETTSTFSMSSHPIKGCDGKPTKFWTGSWGGAAGFFYFTAVVSLIFVLIVTFSYVVLWQVYCNDKRIPLADLAVTALLFVIWFFCISIWWSASNGIGTQTSKENVEEILKNKDKEQFGTFESVSANNGKLAISVLSGWVLVATLALDCWFIWKEVVPRSDENPTQIA
ncbi:unnamed protein product, partial [Mesorhabditis belari]|uniref:MARVEL domain-containing protein n=1 Tax=Mesorhabditis belari TaxID=2138241 RepID=A0AAF3FCY1_9BILA